MHEKKWLAEQFEANRAHLRAVAYRMLGSRAEAEDAVFYGVRRPQRMSTNAMMPVDAEEYATAVMAAS